VWGRDSAKERGHRKEDCACKQANGDVQDISDTAAATISAANASM